METITKSWKLTLSTANLLSLAKYLGYQEEVFKRDQGGGSTAYTPTNVTTDRSYNANATTTDELADVLGTLIADLQGKGLIS